MLCIHLGPGPLGLGLIVEQLGEAGFSVCVVGPSAVDATARERLEYGLAFADPDIGLEYRSVAWACNANNVDDLPSAVLDIVGSEEPVLLTCALGERIRDRVAFIAELVSSRPPNTNTTLLACENDPDESYGAVEARCGDALQVVRCVVDRICTWPTTTFVDEHGQLRVESHKRDDQGRRVVSVHPVAEWVIPTADAESNVLLRELQRASRVIVSTAPADGLIERKRWMVGGLHMVLALIARSEGIDVLPLDSTLRGTFLQIATPMLERIGVALRARWTGIAPDAQYIDDRIRAFVESPDYTYRILGRVLVRRDLRPLMERVNARLGSAARAVAAEGLDPEPFYAAMALLVSVLSDRARYYDRGEWSPVEAVDEQALDMFAEALVGWLDEARASDLLAALRRTLAADREGTAG